MLMLALFLGLPQLVGWIASRVTHRSSVMPWPAAAVAAFSALWYVLDWLPAQRFGERSGCGMPEQSAMFLLAAGLVIHTCAGLVFGGLTRRRRQPRA